MKHFNFVLPLFLAMLSAAPVVAQPMMPPLGAEDEEGPAGGRVRDMISAMSPEGQKLLRDSVTSGLQANRVRVQELQQLRREIQVHMGAEKFDPSALRKVFARERQIAQELQLDSHERMIAAFSKLSLSDRRAAVQWFGQRRDRTLRRGFSGEGRPMGRPNP
jgi:uncharacterized membrane protein